MKTTTTALLATTCLLLATSAPASAQGPGGANAGGANAGGATVGGATVGFRSEAKLPIVVQGYSSAGGMLRRGQPLVMTYGKMAFENNVPAGVRYYTIYDANQPSRVLLRDFPISLQGGEAFFILRSAPNNPLRLLLVPEMP